MRNVGLVVITFYSTLNLPLLSIVATHSVDLSNSRYTYVTTNSGPVLTSRREIAQEHLLPVPHYLEVLHYCNNIVGECCSTVL